MTDIHSMKTNFEVNKTGQDIPADVYRKYLYDVTASHLFVKLLLALILLGYFLISDLYITGYPHSVYTRLLPIGIAASLLVYHLQTRGNKPFKTKLYNLFLLSLTLMMYAKSLLHIEDPDYAGHITGLIVVIFLASLDLRVGVRDALLFYFIPPFVTSILLWLFFNPGFYQITTLVNVLPMIIIGYAANRIQNSFRHKIFRSNYLLKQEKQRTEYLLNQTRETNQQLNQANRELYESEKSLKNALEVKNKLFSVIAHDLYGPFNSLLGFSSLLSSIDPEQEPEKVKNYTTLMLQGSKTLYSLTDNLLNWARSQMDDIQLKPESINLREVIAEAADVAGIQALSKDIRIHQAIAPGLLIEADRETLAITIRNLLSNAVKYSHRGGSVSISATKEDGKVLIKVSDTGIGIPREMQARLFTINENHSRPGTEQEKGTGLGLVLCRSFVEMNNGTISVSSREGKGSTFTITLPAA